MLPNHFDVSDSGALCDTRLPNCYGAPLRAVYCRTFSRIENVAQLKSTLRAGAYAWPGGYPIHLVLSDGGMISFATARAEFANLVDALRNNDNSGWRPIAAEVLWEGIEFDAHTGAPLESAYGDPDAINLDGMAPEDLRNYADDENNPPALRDYAARKSLAMNYRASGRIADAMAIESALESAYADLPQHLQW